MQIYIQETKRVHVLVMKALVDRKEKEKMTDIPKEIKLLLAKFIEVILHDLLDRLLLMRDI